MITLNTIKNWFRTGSIPTQAQFWATFDSFFHKEERIPQESIQDLPATLDAKAERVQFDALITDLEAALQLLYTMQPKEEGKGLSEQNYALGDKEKLDGLFNYTHPEKHSLSDVEGLEAALETATNGKGFNYRTEVFIGNGTMTQFQIPLSPIERSERIYVNGRRLIHPMEYDTQGKFITFQTAPPSGKFWLIDYVPLAEDR